VTADELYAAYRANEVRADATYKDTILLVTGRVRSIGKDILNTPYVSLYVEEELLGGVQCMFSDADIAQLSMLHKGQTVTIQGRCSGLLMNVILRECSLR